MNMGKTKVLLIDDEPAELKRLSQILAQHEVDYETFTAINANMGISIAIKREVDIAICDWQMPELDGIEFVKILKKHPKLKEIPIIMVTGVMVNDKNLAIALHTGASDFIRKPVIGIELIARINAALRTHQYFQDKIVAEQKAAKLQQENLKARNEKLSSLLFQFERKNKALISVKKKMIKLFSDVSNLNSQIGDIDDIIDREINTEGDWAIFNMHMQAVDNDFNHKLKTKFPKLTDYDLRLCTYLKFNLSNQNVADIMNVELKSVHTAKNRLRKKLKLQSAADLTTFLQNL